MSKAIARPSAKDFHVPADSIEFTEAHLETHLSIFNKNTYPEYFTDFEHKGLTYIATVLIGIGELTLAKANTFGSQKYRPVKNKKFNKIKTSVDIDGIDLRKKPLQVVVSLNEGGDVVSVEYLFNGNTLNLALDSGSNLQNRICAIYIKNSNFSIPNLVEIGANQNSLEKEFSQNDKETLEHCLRTIVQDEDGYPLREDPTEKEVSEWTSQLKNSLEFMSGGKNVDSKFINNLIIDLLNQKVKKTVARSITNGIQALEELRKIGYVDTPTVKYGSYSAYWEKIPSHFLNVYTNHSIKVEKGSLEYFDFTKGRYELIIHSGAPDMCDPINWWFTRMIEFHENFTRLENFNSPTGYINGAQMYVIGAYQPLDCLSHIWPMDTVVSFEDIVEYHENNKGNLGQVIDTSIKVNIPFKTNMMENLINWWL